MKNYCSKPSIEAKLIPLFTYGESRNKKSSKWNNNLKLVHVDLVRHAYDILSQFIFGHLPYPTSFFPFIVFLFIPFQIDTIKVQFQESCKWCWKKVVAKSLNLLLTRQARFYWWQQIALLLILTLSLKTNSCLLII